MKKVMGGNVPVDQCAGVTSSTYCRDEEYNELATEISGVGFKKEDVD